MAQAKEQQLKKKLHSFLQELPKLSALKGFRYFATYLRGREELVLSVINELGVQDSRPRNEEESRLTARRASHSSSFTSGNLPYDKESLLMSNQTQRLLSNLGHQGVGLPPASPSEHETVNRDGNQTIFLLAGYGRYSCPYVWVRSNHERLVRLTGEAAQERDCPLKLKTTKAWPEQAIQIWDIVAELVKLCTFPAPLNPFAIDWEYFDGLPRKERLLATAAMAAFLHKVILMQKKDRSFTAKVLEDLEYVTKCHFTDLGHLVKSTDSSLGKMVSESLTSSFASGQDSLGSSSRSLHASSGEQQLQYGLRGLVARQPSTSWNYNTNNCNNNPDATTGSGAIWYSDNVKGHSAKTGNEVQTVKYRTGML